jgi:2,5-dihydroxypyridine 5,6-dioxygenase
MSTPIVPQMWKQMFALCNLKSGEEVAVLVRRDRPSRYSAIAVQVAEALGARVCLLEVTDPSHLPEPALGAAARSGLLLDLAFSHDQRLYSFLDDGLRILVAVEPPEVLARMFPTLDDKRRCLAARTKLASSSRMRVVSDAGTNFEVALGEYEASCQYGFVEERGRWDQWPGAFVYSFPSEGSANGTVVLDRGDILLPMKSYIQSPIRLTIKNGYITDISGGFDAAYIADIFKSYNDPEVYAISHLGWGLSRNGLWNALGLYDKADTEGQDGRAFWGNFLFSTGPNVNGGGTRKTACHIDIPMRNCSLFLDEELIVLQGKVIANDQTEAGSQAAE